MDSGKSIPVTDAGDPRKTHYHGALRSRDPVPCLGALRQWLVLRWHVATEKRSNFADRSSWYATKLLPARFSLPEKGLSDATQRTWIALALQAVGVDTSRAVHTMGGLPPASPICERFRQTRYALSFPLPSLASTNYAYLTDNEGGRLGAWRLGHQLPLPPPSHLYEGCCRVWDRPRQLPSREGTEQPPEALLRMLWP